MAKCNNCGKGSQRAANRSHAKNKTLRRQKPNLQKIEGEMICSSCRRTIAKNMATATT